MTEAFPNRLTEEQADALGFRALRHILEYHGDLALDTDVDEGGRAYGLLVNGDLQSSADLLDLLTVDSAWLCDEHAQSCKDIGTEWGCPQVDCHRVTP